MFTLAFCSLAGLQLAGKAINYSQSSVLGEKTTIESTMGGKPNFVKCEENKNCRSGICDSKVKVCLPKNVPTRSPAITGEPVPTSTMTTSEYIPCTDLLALETKYCTTTKPGQIVRIFGQISCATFKNNITTFCKTPTPRPTGTGLVPTRSIELQISR